MIFIADHSVRGLAGIVKRIDENYSFIWKKVRWHYSTFKTYFTFLKYVKSVLKYVIVYEKYQ